jgi:hypothetical protein
MRPTASKRDKKASLQLFSSAASLTGGKSGAYNANYGEDTMLMP